MFICLYVANICAVMMLLCCDLGLGELVQYVRCALRSVLFFFPVVRHLRIHLLLLRLI